MITNELKKTIKIALEEDIGTGDWTTLWLIPQNQESQARIVAKQEGVIAGLEIARNIYNDLSFTAFVKDGAKVKPNQTVAVIEGSTQKILSSERTVLNFMQRMSGIATQTNKFVKEVEGTKAKILDTRKTAPGLRSLDKWAVRLGGGQNHRIGLFDMILVKDNHLSTLSITEVINRLKKRNNKNLEVEIEVDNLLQLKEALAAGAKRILLDNMDLETIKKAVEINSRRAKLEVSGKVTLETVRDIALTGVDYISVGSLTHSVKALDLSIDIQ